MTNRPISEIPKYFEIFQLKARKMSALGKSRNEIAVFNGSLKE